MYIWIIMNKKQVESTGIHVQASLHSLPLMRGHIECTLPSTIKMQQHVCVITAQGNPIPQETQCPECVLWIWGFCLFVCLLGAGHISTLCLACVKIPGSHKKIRYSAWTTLFVQSRIVSHPYNLEKVLHQCRELLPAKFPEAIQRPRNLVSRSL